MTKILQRSFILLTAFGLLLTLILHFNPYANQVRGQIKGQPEYILLGDSHVYAIGQTLLAPGFANLAYNSDTVSEMLIKLLYSIKNNPNLKGVIITAGYHLFSDYRLDRKNEKIISPLVNFPAFSLVTEQSYSDYLKYRISAFFDPNIYSISRHEWIKGIIFSLVPQKTGQASWADIPASERVSIADNRVSGQMDNPWNDQLALIYREIANQCRANNLEVIAIRYPLSREYLDSLNGFKFARIDLFYKDLPFDHFFDYSGMILDAQYFLDADHLNEAGNIKLLQKLSQDSGLDIQGK